MPKVGQWSIGLEMLVVVKFPDPFGPFKPALRLMTPASVPVLWDPCNALQQIGATFKCVMYSVDI